MYDKMLVMIKNRLIIKHNVCCRCIVSLSIIKVVLYFSVSSFDLVLGIWFLVKICVDEVFDFTSPSIRVTFTLGAGGSFAPGFLSKL